MMILAPLPATNFATLLPSWQHNVACRATLQKPAVLSAGGGTPHSHNKKMQRLVGSRTAALPAGASSQLNSIDLGRWCNHLPDSTLVQSLGKLHSDHYNRYKGPRSLDFYVELDIASGRAVPFVEWPEAAATLTESLYK
jgi:hypothetical protein